ncbi:hypothetical protein [Burkholderia gladioli]|uniref:hypothetical protein n=1 Tax=Burkholderia gladioli TaxID=28095 RepID=UPI00163E2CE6|nr:hypothetical protein [Burkholderia gladioli]
MVVSLSYDATNPDDSNHSLDALAILYLRRGASSRLDLDGERGQIGNVRRKVIEQRQQAVLEFDGQAVEVLDTPKTVSARSRSDRVRQAPAGESDRILFVIWMS